MKINLEFGDFWLFEGLRRRRCHTIVEGYLIEAYIIYTDVATKTNLASTKTITANIEFNPKLKQDNLGNICQTEVNQMEWGDLTITMCKLEEGKTTLRGSHKKLAKEIDCAYTDRLSCNYGTGFDRCKYMKYDKGYWKCLYKNN